MLYSLILYIHNTGMFLLNAPRAVSSKYRKRHFLAGGKKRVARRSISRERASRFATYTEIWKILWNISYLISWLKSYGLVPSSCVFIVQALVQAPIFVYLQLSYIFIYARMVHLLYLQSGWRSSSLREVRKSFVSKESTRCYENSADENVRS